MRALSLEAFRNYGGNVIGLNLAAFEVVTVDCAQDLFCQETSQLVRLSIFPHNLTLHPSEGIAYPKIAKTGEWEIED